MVEIVTLAASGWRTLQRSDVEPSFVDEAGVKWVYVGEYRRGIVGAGPVMQTGPVGVFPAFIPDDESLRDPAWRDRLGIREETT